MKKTLLFTIFIMTLAEICCADVCVTVDTSSWTNEQKAMKKAAAYRLAFEAGQNNVPNVDGDNICFSSPSFDVPSTITGVSILNRIAKQLSDNAIAIQAEKTERDSFQSEMDTLSSQLEADDLGWASLTTNQKIAVMKKILRREVLKQKLIGKR